MTTETEGNRSMNGGAEGGDRFQQAASNIADQAGRAAEAQASSTMTKAGDTIQQVADAVRQAGQNMRDQQPQMADIADTAAQRVEDVSRYLREHDAREVMDTLQREARRQPAVVIGGGLAIGLLLGRFLRSGSSNEYQGSMNRFATGGGDAYRVGYGTGYGSGATGSYGTTAGYGASGYGTAGYGTAGYGSTGAALGGAGTMGTTDTSTDELDLGTTDAMDAGTSPGERDAFAGDITDDTATSDRAG
jgi:hypothetical protein